MKKRILSMLLVLVMIIGILPMSAAADQALPNDTVTVWFSAVDGKTGDFIVTRRELEVPAGTMEKYGWENAEPGHLVGGQDHGVEAGEVTPMDALLAAHEEFYGAAFSPETKDNYIGGSSFYVTKIFNRTSQGGISFAVNDRLPVGPVSDGFAANEYVLQEGDELVWYVYGSDMFDDHYSYFVNEDGDSVRELGVIAGEEFTLSLEAFYAMEQLMYQPGPETPELTILNPENVDIRLANKSGKGAIIATGGAIATTDANGSFSYTFDEPGNYYLSANGTFYSDRMDMDVFLLMPWCEVEVVAPPFKADGVLWVPEYPGYYIVDTVLEEAGDLAVPFAFEHPALEEGAALSVYILSYNWETEEILFKEAPVVDGKLTMDSAFKEMVKDNSIDKAFYISTSGHENYDALEQHMYSGGFVSYMSIIVLPVNNFTVRYSYDQSDVNDIEAIEISYDENGSLNPSYINFSYTYEDENGDPACSNEWSNLVEYASDDSDVVSAERYSFKVVGKGEAILTISCKDNFWSGFGDVQVKVEVAKDIDEATVAVIDSIRALPARANIFDEAVVVATRQAYDALTQEQQAKVANYGKLEALERELAELKASFSGLLYAMGYTAEGSSTTTEISVMNGREEWTGANIAKTVQSVSLKAAVSEEIAKVTVNGTDMIKSDGLYTLNLERPAEHDGLVLYTVELYKEGSAAADERITVMLFWSGDYAVSYTQFDRNGFLLSNTQIKLFRGELGDLEFITRAYTPNNAGCSAKHTSYTVANRIAERVWILFVPRYQNYSSDVKIVDPSTGATVSQYFGTVNDHRPHLEGPEAGEGIELKVGSNLLLVYMWPVNYKQEENAFVRRTEKPTVIAMYLDRLDDSLSDDTNVTSVEVVGDVGGKYELVQKGETNYEVKTLCNETGIKAIFKMPEVVEFDSSRTSVRIGSGYPAELTPVSDTVEDGVRTVVCHWGTVSPRDNDFYSEYGGTGTIVTRAEDGVSINSFWIDFLRPANPADGVTDSDLKTLSVSSRSELTYEKDGEIKTGFDPDVTEYRAELASNVTDFYVTSIAKFAAQGATVTVDGIFVIQSSNNARQGKSEVYSAYAGMNQIIEIVVTPPKGSSLEPKTYTITVTKPQAAEGAPLVKNWEARAGSVHQLMNPDTTGSSEVLQVSKVALSYTNDEDGSTINPGMLFRYDNITAAGMVDGACSALILNPDIAMSSAPLKFSYTVNGGERVDVPGVKSGASTIKAFNIPIPENGENVIVITISDEAGTQSRVHTFKITKAPDATLSGLGSEDAVFVGKFNPTIYRMNMMVEPGTESVSVTATATEPEATVEFNGVSGIGSATAEGLVVGTEYTIKVSYGGQTYNYYLVIMERQAISANRVWAVMPAPGQFVNEHSQTVTGTMGAQGWGDGWDTTLYGATPEQAGRSNYAQPGFSLGWFGGFIIYEFDEPVQNSDKNMYGIDFTVYGNAFYGNSEPAGVEVSQDGETWYTLAGSKHYDPDTVWDYEVTYTNPYPDFDPYMAVNVPWKDNKGNGGVYLSSGGYHPQPSYPVAGNYLFGGNRANESYSAEQLTFSGTNIIGRDSAYWGYADTHPNSIDNFDKPGNPYRIPQGGNDTRYAEGDAYGDGFDISWAVDKDGRPVYLDFVKYVKVYSASMEVGVGEVSPEITAIARTTGESEAVGTTEAPVITVNGRTLKLSEGVYSYEVPMSGTVEITASIEGGVVWINNDYDGTFNEENVPGGRIVRVLAQKGESQPAIYYLTMLSSAAGDEDIAAVEDMIAAIGEVTLEKETQIKNARAAYRALPGGLQYLVSNYDVLVAAEAALRELKGDDEDVSKTISVSMRLIGAELAEDDVDLGQAEIMPDYVTWIATARYVLNEGSTVYDLFVEAMNDAGLREVGASNNYVATIYAPEGYELSEFTNGARSGWMYTINGDHPGFGLRQQKLKDGDVVVWHYVNDYAYEVHDWDALGGEGWPALGDGRYYSRWLMAPDRVGGKGGGLDGSGSGGRLNPDTIIEQKTKVGAGGAEAVVDSKAVDAAVDAAKKSAANAVTVIPTETGDAENVTTTLPTESVEKIADAGLALNIETPGGSVEIPSEALGEIVKSAEGDSISVNVAKQDKSRAEEYDLDEEVALVAEVIVTSAGREITSFGGHTISVYLPVEESDFTEGESYEVLVISKGGSSQLLEGVCVKMGGKLFVKVEIDHLSTFIVTRNKPLPFKDVKGHWAIKGVRFAYNRGFMAGVSPAKFNPDGKLTRGMLVTMLHSLEGKPSITLGGFSDVAGDKWYAAGVAWAKEKGIVAGFADGTFRPEELITREQFATIMMSYARFKNQDVSKRADLTAYSDAGETSAWALDALKWAKATGLMSGRSESVMAPKGTATRAEAATILMNYLKSISQ